MEGHIGVDAESGLVHSVISTVAHANDVTQGHALLHGEESVMFANAGSMRDGNGPKPRRGLARAMHWASGEEPG